MPCLQYGLADEIVGQEDSTISGAKQRFEQAIKYEIQQHAKVPQVPENLKTQKTNAEKLMQIFKNKNLEGK